MAQSANQGKATRSEKEAIKQETMEDGRYIPHSGGIMGWFENSLVLNCEKGNNYRYHSVIDAHAVRQKLFERWGAGDSANRRVSQRFKMDREININLDWEGQSVLATTKDFSSYGMRLQVNQDELALSKGDSITLKVFDSPERNTPKFELAAQIMWITKMGRRRMSWSLGIGFPDLSMEESMELKAYFQAG